MNNTDRNHPSSFTFTVTRCVSIGLEVKDRFVVIFRDGLYVFKHENTVTVSRGV